MNINDLFTSKETREEELAAALSSYSPAVQTLLAQHLTGGPEDHKPMFIALMMTRDEALALEVLAIYPQCTYETGPAFNKTHYLIGIVRGLHDYPQYKNTRLDTLTGDNMHEVISLVSITSLILRYYENPPLIIMNPDDPHSSSIHFKNSEAVTAIINHHHRTSDLNNCLSEPLTPLAVSGLPHLLWYQKQTLNSITEETINAALNYLRVTSALQRNTDKADLTIVRDKDQKKTASYISNPALALFIEENPNAVEDFIDYTEERWSADLTAFHEYMDNGTILKEGVL